MAGTRAAIRYAKAILESAKAKGSAEAVSKDMTSVASVLTDNQELSTFLQSPTIQTEVKSNALLEIFASATPVTKSLFRLLSENKRFEILRDVAVEYNTLFDEMNNVETATVTTAFPIDSGIEAKVLERIRTFSDKKVEIKNIVDPSIIGGFILRMGDKQYNASIANRLLVLRRELLN